MDSVGTPKAIVKDAGSELSRGTNLLGEQGYEFACINDISHYCANLLKRQYGDHPQLEIFLSACGKISTRFKQTILACLAPPKTTFKARFMNLHRLVRWAGELLILSPPGGAKKGSVLAKLRENLGDLPECKNFIKLFHRDASALLACQKILKNKGLSNHTYQECKELLKAIPTNSIVYSGFIAWLDEHIEIAKQQGLDEKGMLITSDNIESCFGRGKVRTAGAIKDANRIALLLPAFCGKISKEDIQKVLATTVREQREFEAQLPSVHKQRRKVFGGAASLESLASEAEKTQLVLKLVGPPDNRLQSKDQVDVSTSVEKQGDSAERSLVCEAEDKVGNQEINAHLTHEAAASAPQEHPEKTTTVERKSHTSPRTPAVTLEACLKHLQRFQDINHEAEEEKKVQEQREKAKVQIDIHEPRDCGQQSTMLEGHEYPTIQQAVIINNIIKLACRQWGRNEDMASESMPCRLTNEPESIAQARGSPHAHAA